MIDCTIVVVMHRDVSLRTFMMLCRGEQVYALHEDVWNLPGLES